MMARMARGRGARTAGATGDPGVERGGQTEAHLPAGEFSSWLQDMRRALRAEDGVDVDCGGCDACCTSSLFIHIRADEARTLARVPEGLAFPAPGTAAGDRVLGYDERGRCPMLRGMHCSIYEHRPATCRIFDCRVYAAAGVHAGDDRRRIGERAARWRFTYSGPAARRQHDAVRAAARFIRENPGSFPGGRVPTDPGQVAVLAVKSYEVFLDLATSDEASDAGADRVSDRGGDRALDHGDGLSTADRLAAAVVEACRRFDAGEE
jgi:hypothetical protein